MASAGERLERLGAVTGLDEEGSTTSHAAEGGGEVAGLTGEHERRVGRQLP
jgi:hypothetical protein